MENTYNPKKAALMLIASQVEDYEDLINVQTITGLDMRELETMYYSII